MFAGIYRSRAVECYGFGGNSGPIKFSIPVAIQELVPLSGSHGEFRFLSFCFEPLAICPGRTPHDFAKATREIIRILIANSGCNRGDGVARCRQKGCRVLHPLPENEFGHALGLLERLLAALGMTCVQGILSFS